MPYGNPHNAPGELVAAVRAKREELSPSLTEFLAAKNSSP